MRENITLRRTKRSIPLLAKVEQISKSQTNGKDKFAPTLFDILELGLKSYEAGNRVLDNEVIKKADVFSTGERSRYSVFNEVTESLYSGLAGAIANLSYYEESKLSPNQSLIHYYKLIRQALWVEKSNFSNLTDKEIEQVTNQLSPIKKSLFGDKGTQQAVIEKNKQLFDDMINKTGVANG